MAIIRPFKGFRYNTEKAGGLEDLVTPPYDVIGKHAESAFVARSPYNIIRLDITKDPGKTKADEQDRYLQAVSLLHDWLKEGILLRDDQSSVYPYTIKYRLPDGTTKIRLGFICLVRLTDFSEGIVKPHEQTFTSVIQDRLMLTRYCRAQFSQVFSVFSDPDNSVMNALAAAASTPLSSVNDSDGNEHILSQVSDKAVLESIVNLFKEKDCYIADGHHRYTTALAYRNELKTTDKTFTDERPENYIMMYLCPMEDKGLSILPTHRLVMNPAVIAFEPICQRLKKYFDIKEISVGSRETLLEELMNTMTEDSNGVDQLPSFGLYHPGEDRGCFLKKKNNADYSDDKIHRAVRNLDAVVLTTLIIEKILGLNKRQCEEENLITFHSDLHEALDISVKRCAGDHTITPLLFLMKPTKIQQVREVSDQGQVMPHKSTYFYPKIMTGLVLNLFKRPEDRDVQEPL